ncbi:UvrD-helicase domain-containing protein [Brevibacillus massiliensis]|uniref:UvrD-helicase domain-containing protein n=1 Tax=Brevibacillus massiliensis TaxID=1118054 RepID=UPI0002E39318|nr:ATP-dependent helicase [Brevibacillus massiliensis]
MKYALHNGETIFLHPSTYAKIPDWRIWAASGSITCPECGDQLRLVAGISQEPYFQHTSRLDCPLQGMDQPDGLPLSAARETAAGSHSPFRKRLAPRQKIQALLDRAASSLHPAQWQAVTTTEGPLLILAGAGSGKTRVMTARTAYLIREKAVDPRSIMVVTFTTKAAAEIKQRLSEEIPAQQVRALIAGTFHSLFYRMLQHHDPVRWDGRRLLKHSWQKLRLLRESGLGQGEDLPVKESDWEAALDVISRWKNECLQPSDAGVMTPASDEEKWAQTLYPLYESAKDAGGWFDFDDMLLGCYELLKGDPQVRQFYQSRIAYLMIDEFQDINRVQYETVKLLAAPQNNLCVIGDDDQSIYGFRGSDPQYILGFTKDYPEAKSIVLEVNYRSRSAIVGLGYSLIGNNHSRWKKELKAYHLEEGDCYLFYPADEEEQASRIVDEITCKLAEGISLSDIAILFRTYESTRPLIERLTEAKIPFSCHREGEAFYEKQAVRWALGYLRLSLDRDDQAALRDILPTLYVSAEQWNEIRSEAILRDLPLLDALPRLSRLKVYQRKHLQKVADVLAQLGQCTPVQALELIYEDLKLRDYVKKRASSRGVGDEERAVDDLRALLVAARRHLTLRDFLDHTAALLESEKQAFRDMHTNGEGVQLMSIHRAKGLEFDLVFIVDLVEGVLPHEYAMEQLRRGSRQSVEEERRLMYVAITRARHKLYIGVPQERFGRKARASRFIAEMSRENPPR